MRLTAYLAIVVTATLAVVVTAQTRPALASRVSHPACQRTVDCAGEGPLLVVAAHPDDEALGMSGVIDRAVQAHRRVVVAVTTNGDHAGGCSGYGQVRNQETIAAMRVLGLTWSTDLATTNIVFLGYPNGQLTELASSSVPITYAGKYVTHAFDGDPAGATCTGDFGYLATGHHSPLDQAGLASDLDGLLKLVRPTDVYTHVPFDGHDEHDTVYLQVLAAMQRSGQPATLHATLIHAASCTSRSARLWPNPPLYGNAPTSRFQPGIDFTAPPLPQCTLPSTGSSWGPWGPPNQSVVVPLSMQNPDQNANRKWRVLSHYQSQFNCKTTLADGTWDPTCGYFLAFVKHDEIFWARHVGPPALITSLTVRRLGGGRFALRAATSDCTQCWATFRIRGAANSRQAAFPAGQAFTGRVSLRRGTWTIDANLFEPFAAPVRSQALTLVVR